MRARAAAHSGLPTAPRLCRAALRCSGKNHVGVATVLNNMAATYHSMGELDKSLKLYAQTLAIHEESAGPHSQARRPAPPPPRRRPC